MLEARMKLTEITEEEIEEAIDTSKRRKASGPDETPMEVYKELDVRGKTK